MRRGLNLLRILHSSAIAAVIVLMSGSPALAQGGEAPGEEGSPPSLMESHGGGCCRGSQDAEGGEPGFMCQGKRAGQGGHGMRHREGRGQGKGKRIGAGGGRPGGRRGDTWDLMRATRALVHDYRLDIVREVEDIANGVVTITRAPESPEAAAVLQRHVREMKGLLDEGGRIRAWDPLFREIFDHADEVDMVVETLDDGIRVTETSANPEVVKLIRAHARKVDAFLARGPAAVHEPTPLPVDYQSGD